MNLLHRQLTAIGLSLTLTFPIDALAAGADEHAAHHPGTPAANTPPAETPATDTAMENMRSRMRAMREERDPQKRMAMVGMQKKDMAAMMEHMGKAGSGMRGGAGGMGCMMMGKDGGTPTQGTHDDGMGGSMHGMMARHMEMMDMRMEMMQMMVEQMAAKRQAYPSPRH